MRSFALTVLIALSASLVGSLALMPQAAAYMTVFGRGEAANCAQAARFSRLGVGEIRSCDAALADANLSRRDRAATLVNRGILLTNMRQFDRALADFDQAGKIQSMLPEVHVGRGNVFFRRARFADAVAEYNKSLALDINQRPEVLYNRALAYAALGEFALALADIDEVISLRPDWELAFERRQRLISQSTQLAEQQAE